MNSFVSRLAALIEAKGWTQIEAARQLDVSQTLISRYLSGKRVPLPRTITHIAERLGVSPVELTGKTPAKGVAGAHKSQLTGRQELNLDEPPSHALKNLKRRWKRSKTSRDEISLAIRVLFPEDADDILTWLQSR